MSKYVSVEDLEDMMSVSNSITESHSIAYNTLYGSINRTIQTCSVDMVKVSDVQYIIDNFSIGNASNLILEIQNLIIPKPKKYGGFTLKEWERLNDLAWVQVADTLLGECFLGAVMDSSKIVKLLPDPTNMERTNTNIPNGIKIEITDTSGSKDKVVTPYSFEFEDLHYRIIGKAGD